ncbi:MAG TPA: lipid II flippase MurJ, partial [candidate division Zixibacteria bacterium]|nr:lipid II flippase MurJ [candidate division Zixibacteria bacterium]
ALYFSASLWVKLFAPGLPSSEIPFGVRAFQVLLLFVFGTAIEAILRSYYQVEGHFGLTAFSPLLSGLVVLASVFFLSGKLSVYALAWGWAVGSLLPVAVMVLALFFYLPIERTSAPVQAVSVVAAEWKELTYVLIVAVLGQLMVLLDRFFGSFLPPESLSAFYYASLPVLFPMGILIYPVGYAIFPKLSKGLREGMDAEASTLFSKALGWVNFVLIPMSVLFILAPEEIIRLIFERGAFGAISTDLSGRTLRIFAFSLLASGYIFVLSRAYLALGLGKRLAEFCIAAFLFKGVVAYPVIRMWGLEGLAGAGSTALVGLALLQFWRLPGRVNPFTRRLGFASFKLAGLSLLAFGGSLLVSSFLVPSGLYLREVFLLFVFGFLYVAGCYILKVPEFSETVNLFRRLVGRKLPYGTASVCL